MHILITNNGFEFRAGTELFCRDVALALRDRSHEVTLYSNRLGALAADLKREGLSVVNDLEALSTEPDIIHAQHHLDGMTALLRYPRVPAVFMCHGANLWLEEPILFPSIRRYMGVDDPTRDRLLKAGIAPHQVRVLRTAVDLGRFPLREAWKERPQRAIIFSGYPEDTNQHAVLAEACRNEGITQLDMAEALSPDAQTRPESILSRYDVVFAKGRAAHEAAATGAAVIVTHAGKLGGMLTPDNYAEYRRLNLGFRTLRETLTVKNVQRELRHYDIANVRTVAAHIRRDASLADAVDRLLQTYQEARDESDALAAVNEIDFQRAAAAYQRWLSLAMKSKLVGDPFERRLFLWRRRIRRWLQRHLGRA